MGLLEDAAYALGFSVGPTPAQDTAFGFQRGGPGPGEFLDDPISSLARAGGFSVGITPEEDTAFGVKRGGPGLLQASHEFFMGRPDQSQPQQQGPKAPAGVKPSAPKGGTGTAKFTTPDVPPPEVKFKPGKSPREKDLAAQGFTNFAPGVSYRDDSNIQGPRKTISAFGQEREVPSSGGSASMMQISGNTPGARALLQEQRGQQIEDATFQNDLRAAQMTPEQRAHLQAQTKPDVRLEAWRAGIAAAGARMRAEDEAEARAKAEWAAKSPGTQPPPAYLQDARARAAAPFKRMEELAEAGLTQDRKRDEFGLPQS